MSKCDPSDHLDGKVAFVGIAQNEKTGACVILSDGSPVYILNLDYWDKMLDRKQIKLTGILRWKKLFPDPFVNDKGEHTAGKLGSDFCLEEAAWEEALF